MFDEEEEKKEVDLEEQLILVVPMLFAFGIALFTSRFNIGHSLGRTIIPAALMGLAFWILRKKVTHWVFPYLIIGFILAFTFSC